MVVLWLLFGWLLLRLDERFPRASLHVGARATLGLAVASGLFALTVGVNPYFVPRAVGATPVFNAILLAYGIPAVLTLFLAREFRRRCELACSRVASISSLIFWFLLINLQVRQVFHGRLLTEGPTTNAETYAYSAAWIIFGVILLVVGIVTRGVVVRWASLAVMVLAVSKVFFFDLAELRDLLRVLSVLVPESALLPPVELIGGAPPQSTDEGLVGRVRLTRLATPTRPPGGALEAVLGSHDDPEMQFLSIAGEHGLRIEFPADVLAAAAQLPDDPSASDCTDRTDLRELPFVTIDGETARDFDDAVCLDTTAEHGTRLWVAIADVAHYVEPGTPLDREAAARGTSVYFPDRAIPMLPPQLSTQLCSDSRRYAAR